MSKSLVIVRLVILTAVGLIAFALPVFAVNTHTINGVYHGYGDGTDIDAYAHPFVEYQNNDFKIADFRDYKVFNQQCFSEEFHARDGNGAHIHNDISHPGYGAWEVTWYAQTSSSVPWLSYHNMRHHSGTGQCE